jgi:hypothetical protein
VQTILEQLEIKRAAAKLGGGQKRNLTRFVTASLLLLSVMSLAGCQTLRTRLLWLPPGMSGMERVASEVVLELPVTQADTNEVNAMQEQAKHLLAQIWPDRRSSPQLWVCRTETCNQRLGGGSPLGKTFGHSRVLLSPRGRTAGILAHEWWHAEFWKRIGLANVSNVPRWFDEGVAVWISQEAHHSQAMYQRVLAEGIEPPRLDTLLSFKDWDAAVGRYGDHLKPRDSDVVNVVYPTAGHEVRRWINIVGAAGLRKLVSELAAGADFSASYAEIERKAKP